MSQADKARTTLKSQLAGAALAQLMLISASAAAQGDELATAIEAVVTSNIAAINAEDADATMATIHGESPEFDSTASALDDHFADLDPSAELVSFAFMGHDDEFAVARVKIKTSEKSDTAFHDNIVDMIVLFAQEDGNWKIWSDLPLGVELDS